MCAVADRDVHLLGPMADKCVWLSQAIINSNRCVCVIWWCVSRFECVSDAHAFHPTHTHAVLVCALCHFFFFIHPTHSSFSLSLTHTHQLIAFLIPRVSSRTRTHNSPTSCVFPRWLSFFVTRLLFFLSIISPFGCVHAPFLCVRVLQFMCMHACPSSHRQLSINIGVYMLL